MKKNTQAKVNDYLRDKFISNTDKEKTKRQLTAAKLEAMESLDDAMTSVISYCTIRNITIDVVSDQYLIFIKKPSLHYRCALICLKKTPKVLDIEKEFLYKMFKSEQCFPFFSSSSIEAIDAINNYLTNGFGHLRRLLAKGKIPQFHKKSIDFYIPEPI